MEVDCQGGLQKLMCQEGLQRANMPTGFAGVDFSMGVCNRAMEVTTQKLTGVCKS
jgi:hypothetical protein